MEPMQTPTTADPTDAMLSPSTADALQVDSLRVARCLSTDHGVHTSDTGAHAGGDEQRFAVPRSVGVPEFSQDAEDHPKKQFAIRTSSCSYMSKSPKSTQVGSLFSKNSDESQPPQERDIATKMCGASFWLRALSAVIFAVAGMLVALVLIYQHADTDVRENFAFGIGVAMGASLVAISIGLDLKLPCTTSLSVGLTLLACLLPALGVASLAMLDLDISWHKGGYLVQMCVWPLLQFPAMAISQIKTSSHSVYAMGVKRCMMGMYACTIMSALNLELVLAAPKRRQGDIFLLATGGIWGMLCNAILGITMFLMVWAEYQVLILVRMRVRAQVSAFGRKQRIVRAMTLVIRICPLPVLVISVADWEALHLQYWAIPLFLTMYTAFGMLGMLAFAKPLLPLWRELKRKRSRIALLEVRWAIRIQALEIFAIFINFASGAFLWGSLVAERGLPHDAASIELAPFAAQLNWLLNIWSLVLMSGSVRGDMCGLHKQTGQEEVSSPHLINVSAESHDCGPAWDVKVKELAYRGFPLEQLLDFYGKLGTDQLMPRFSAKDSTTFDVAAQAVIPFTAEAGCALATLFTGGVPMIADVMATHTWSSVFTHTVAAMVADGLNEDTYRKIEKLLLNKRISKLKRMLKKKGTLQKSYWLCVVSVNQHSCICRSLGERGRTDKVTGRSYPTCSCQHPKFLNSDSEECEVNKFDSVMEYLRLQVLCFSQVIAMDVKFEVFTRAWCLAEIIQAQNSKITQNLKLHSNNTFDANYERLSSLDVQTCKASRPEDKTMILSRIPDIAAFNERLHWNIFNSGGLVARWMDQQDRALTIGRITNCILESEKEMRDTSVCTTNVPLGAQV